MVTQTDHYLMDCFFYQTSYQLDWTFIMTSFSAIQTGGMSEGVTEENQSRFRQN